MQWDKNIYIVKLGTNNLIFLLHLQQINISNITYNTNHIISIKALSFNRFTNTKIKLMKQHLKKINIKIIFSLNHPHVGIIVQRIHKHDNKIII